MNNEIKANIDELIIKIKENKVYKDYINLLEQVNNSNVIKELELDIREIQKKLVRTPSIQLEEELENKKKELEEIPLYLDYKDALDELNNILLIIQDRFNLFIKDLLIDET